VLTVLALGAGEVVSVERLAQAIWGDRGPPSSTKVVQNVVLRLRKVLGHDVIETRAQGYVLSVDRDAVDLHRFDRLWRQGRARVALGDPEGAAALLAGAHDLWRGSPLSDLSADSATCREAERLRLWEQFRDNLEELADVSLVLGRHLEWIPTLELMVIDEPLRERRWELLMVGLHGCGRQAEALRAFQRARVALADVGLEPGSELCDLERRVYSNDQTLPSAPCPMACESATGT
jgi:DNA-binding SARP family transcriptional activator